MVRITFTRTHITSDWTEKEVKELNDKDALAYLKELERQKMQSICDDLELGKYKPSMILYNVNSVNGDYPNRPYGSSYTRAKQPHFDKLAKANEYRTEIKIEQI